MENNFIRHEACPRCRRKGEDRSGNNLAVYSDHVYCFKCGYRSKTNTSKGLRISEQGDDSGTGSGSNVLSSTKQDFGTGVKLPNDFVLSLPDIANLWIKKYELTDREIVRNRIGWSENGLTLASASGNPTPYNPCMIFPVYDIYGNLLMYQARYFGNITNLPKYITKGKPREVLHILGTNEEQPIVIVEDIISAIKVSRVCRAVPAFGSSPSLDWFNRLRKVTPDIILWLDKDKRQDSERLKKRLSVVFDKVKSISTELDPKSYNTEEIERIIT